MGSRINQEGCEALTRILDRWMGILQILRIRDPDSEAVPDRVALQSKKNILILDKPRWTPGFPDPPRHRHLEKANSVWITFTIGNVFHGLNINSSTAPNVIASSGNRHAEPLLTAEAVIALCLEGKVIDPKPRPRR